MMAVAHSILAELDAHVRGRGWSLRIGVDANGPSAPKDRTSRVAWLAVYDKPGREGEELEVVFIPKKKKTSLDEAAGLLLELVHRIPTED